MVESRLVGMRSRGVYETPGGTIMAAAVRELEALTLDRETTQWKDMVRKSPFRGLRTGRCKARFSCKNFCKTTL
jgi:argininosuccinate synthase